MALAINLVDYSPIYNAFNAQQRGFGAQQDAAAGKRNAGLLALQGEANDAATFSALARTAVEAGKVVYAIMQQGALEGGKKSSIELDTWWSQQIQKGLFDGTVKMDPSGQLVIPPELQAEYDARQTAIEKSVEAYPDVHAWVAEQGATTKQNGILHALSVAEPIAKADREAQGKQVLTGALDQSVATGKLDPFYAALLGQTWRSPDEIALLKQLGEQDFNYRTREGGIRNLVSAQGYEAGATAIEAWRTAGDVTPEQADALLTTAANQSKVQGTVIAQQAQKNYEVLTANGMDPEYAVKQTMDGVPEAYKNQTEELLRAAAQTSATRADTGADEKMQDFYANNRDDPAGMRAYLDLPQNDFSRAMKRDTFMYWDYQVNSLLADAAAKAAAKPEAPAKPGTPAQYLNAMRLVISSNWKYPTTDEKKTEIQKIARTSDAQGNFLVTADDYKAYLSMAADDKFLSPVIVRQMDVIHNNFEALRQKDKPNADKYTQEENQAIQQFTTHVKQGEQPTKDLESYVSQLLHPTKTAVFFIDQAGDLTGKARADQRRKDVLTLPSSDPRAALTDEESISMASFDLQRMRDQVGVGVDKGLAFVSANGTDGTDRQSNGLPMFYVKGLDKKNPDTAFTVRFGLDSKGAVILETTDKTGNWIATGYTFKSQQASADAAAAKAAADEAARLAVAAERAAYEAGPFSKLTGAETQQLMDSLNVPNPTRKYIEKMAADLSKSWGLTVTAEQLIAEATRRGIRVKP